MRALLTSSVLSGLVFVVHAQQPANYALTVPDSIRTQVPVDLGGGNTCYAFQHMFNWDSSYVELTWTAPDQLVTNSAAFHLPYPISYVADAARLDDGILVGGNVSAEPNMAVLLKVGDAGNLQWQAHITNVYHQQNGVGAILPHGSAFTAYVYCMGISDGAYRVEGEVTGTTWSGIEMLPPSTIRFSLSGAVAMADPTEHLLFGMGLDMTNLANFKTALVDVRDTGAVWMKLYTMPPQFSYPNNALDVRRTQDGNYICSGSYTVGQVDNGYMMKVDPSGDVLWCRTYADTSGAIHLTSVIELPGGDLLVAGYDLYYQSLLLRLGPSGAIIWQRRSQDPGDVWHIVDKFFTNDAGELKLGLQGRMIGLTAEGEACGFISTNTVTDPAFVPAVTSVVLTNTPFTPLVDTFAVDVRTPTLAWQQTCIYDAIEETTLPSGPLVHPNPTEGPVYLDGVVDSRERVIVRAINGSLVYDGPYSDAVDLWAQPSGAYTIELPRTGQHGLVIKR